jgi:hypothetical protein
MTIDIFSVLFAKIGFCERHDRTVTDRFEDLSQLLGLHIRKTLSLSGIFLLNGIVFSDKKVFDKMDSRMVRFINREEEAKDCGDSLIE